MPLARRAVRSEKRRRPHAARRQARQSLRHPRDRRFRRSGCLTLSRSSHMADHCLSLELKATKEFFDRSTRCFEEANSSFTPIPEGYTVAGHIAHTAQTVDWFI